MVPGPLEPKSLLLPTPTFRREGGVWGTASGLRQRADENTPTTFLGTATYRLEHCCMHLLAFGHHLLPHIYQPSDTINALANGFLDTFLDTT